jgi:hypothetical protein
MWTIAETHCYPCKSGVREEVRTSKPRVGSPCIASLISRAGTSEYTYQVHLVGNYFATRYADSKAAIAIFDNLAVLRILKE